MTQYNRFNVNLSNSQLSKLTSAIQNETKVTLNLSWHTFSDSNDENNFLHTLLLTNKQISKVRKVFPNGSSANIKLSKTQLHKIEQSEGFLGRRLGTLLKTRLPLIGNILKLLAKKSILIPLGLTAGASVIDTAIHKKMFESGFTTLIISNEDMNDMKIVKSLEEFGLLIKDLSETSLGLVY